MEQDVRGELFTDVVSLRTDSIFALTDAKYVEYYSCKLDNEVQQADKKPQANVYNLMATPELGMLKSDL